MPKIITGFNFERKTSIYEKIGVHQYKKILPVGDFWIMLFNKLFGQNLKVANTKQKAIVWLIFTFSVEFLHFVAFIIILWVTIVSAVNANYFDSFKFTLINASINIYPIMAQRYNRIRLIKIFNIAWKDVINLEI